MREEYPQFQKRDAEVIAVAPDTLENARSYSERRDIPFPCLADPERRVFGQYDVRSALISLGQRPGLFVIDKEGVVRYAYLGWQQWEIPTNASVLEALDGLE